jgi:hypothetical protein
MSAFFEGICGWKTTMHLHKHAGQEAQAMSTTLCRYTCTIHNCLRMRAVRRLISASSVIACKKSIQSSQSVDLGLFIALGFSMVFFPSLKDMLKVVL